MALLAVIAGVLCILDDSWFPRPSGWPPLAYPLFAALLCGWLLAEWYSRPLKSHAVVADDRDFTRDLTRRLYLMFYVIIGIGQLIGLVGLRYGGTFHRPDVSFLIVALAGLILVRVPLYIVSRRGE